MEERMRRAEGDLQALKGWRVDQVDPWLKESSVFHKQVKTFMDQLIAREEIREKIDDERHQANSTKMNLIITLATVMLSIIALATFLLTIATMRHQSLIPFNLSNSNDPVLSLEHQPELAGDPPAWIEEK